MSSEITLEELAQKADAAIELAESLAKQLAFLKGKIAMSGGSAADAAPTTAVAEFSTNQIEDLLLQELDKKGDVNSAEFGEHFGLDKNDTYGAIQSLEMDGYVTKEKKTTAIMVPSKDGEEVIANGSPEVRLFNSLPPPGSHSTMTELQKTMPKKELKIAMGKAMMAKLVRMDKKAGTVCRAVAEVKEDSVQWQLVAIGEKGESAVPSKVVSLLKKRKLLCTKKITDFIVRKGASFSLTRVRPLAELTLDDIESHIDFEGDGHWQGPALKAYNLQALAPTPSSGCFHPLMRMRTDMRRILLDMGFEEMHTNNYVESSFWNFDALFQPQQHPARDAHDTFFCKTPAKAKILGKHKRYLGRVKATHESGAETGSIGYRYDWKQSEATKNLLRTHTTAVSSRMLFKLAQTKPFKPKKYFSIDRVFRNEAIDATHLAEFHQVEGFVADFDLTLGHLIGTIAEFFRRIGHADVKFKPAYNPYTEPSMEIFGWSEERQDYIEVGNSGIFRPEMLEPMGLPPNVKVIAWGLGLERPCMISTKLKDIRELFGPRVEADMVKKFPFVRYDKHVEPVS